MGAQLGWGFQLQSPVAVALLAAFFLVLALNLSGLFELRFAFAGRPGGHFLSGVLAVVVASPCTAPFMGAALGYAVLESGWRALAVFTALGLGMALPYAALAASPGWRRYLPKPGPWMPRLKRWLAVPLYATVLWLGWVFAQQVNLSCMKRMMRLGSRTRRRRWPRSPPPASRCSSTSPPPGA